MDKVRAMRTFVTVVEAGGFSSASRLLNVSAPSVTRIIHDLEQELGVTLLLRTTRNVTLTDVGQNYFEDAKDILSTLSDAEEAARGTYGKLTGKLTITAPTQFGRIHVTRSLLNI